MSTTDERPIPKLQEIIERLWVNRAEGRSTGEGRAIAIEQIGNIVWRSIYAVSNADPLQRGGERNREFMRHAEILKLFMDDAEAFSSRLLQECNSDHWFATLLPSDEPAQPVADATFSPDIKWTKKNKNGYPPDERQRVVMDRRKYQRTDPDDARALIKSLLASYYPLIFVQMHERLESGAVDRVQFVELYEAITSHRDIDDYEWMEGLSAISPRGFCRTAVLSAHINAARVSKDPSVDRVSTLVNAQRTLHLLLAMSFVLEDPAAVTFLAWSQVFACCPQHQHDSEGVRRVDLMINLVSVAFSMSAFLSDMHAHLTFLSRQGPMHEGDVPISTAATDASDEGGATGEEDALAQGFTAGLETKQFTSATQFLEHRVKVQNGLADCCNGHMLATEAEPLYIYREIMPSSSKPAATVDQVLQISCTARYQRLVRYRETYEKILGVKLSDHMGLRILGPCPWNFLLFLGAGCGTWAVLWCYWHLTHWDHKSFRKISIGYVFSLIRLYADEEA